MLLVCCTNVDFYTSTDSGLGGAEGPDRIFVGGLPYYFTEVQIRELLESFGYVSWIFNNLLVTNNNFTSHKDMDDNFKSYEQNVIVDLMDALKLCRPLRGFDLVKDRDTGNSKGYGFCVYEVNLNKLLFATKIKC